MPDDAQLRSQLGQISKTSVYEHKERVKRLREEHAHTVEPVQDEEGRAMPPFGTCYAFALGLHEDMAYRCIADCDASAGLERFFASPDFVSWLLDCGKLNKLNQTIPDENALVLYFKASGEPVHAGIGRHEGRVCSKWGIGWVWEHQVWEVPSSYGDDVAYYQRPTVAQARVAFLEWLKEQPELGEFAAAYGLLDLFSECDQEVNG